MKRRNVRGMTLIEIMVAAAIFSVAMLVAFTLTSQAGELIRNGEEVSDSNDNSRLALDYLSALVASAGAGAPNGIIVGGGAGVTINPVFADDNAGPTGADGLWVAAPAPKAFAGYCSAAQQGAASSLMASAPNLLTISNPAGGCVAAYTSFTNLFVSNFAPLPSNTTAFLVSITTLTAPNKIAFPEAINFANYSPGGFKPAQWAVYGANIYHFTVAPNPLNGSRPALYRSAAVVAAAPNAAVPFADVGVAQVLYDNIEDLQIAFVVDPAGSGDTTQYVAQQPQPVGVPGLGLWGPAYAKGLRGVRLTVAAKSAKTLHDTSGRQNTSTTVVNLKPMTIENNSPAAPSDGLRRSVYSRRIELPNMNTETL